MPMHIRRREFIVTLGSAAAAWPIAARAAAKRPRIGVLTLLSREDEGGRIADFAARLRDLGYIEGRNLDMDYRYADGDTERLNALARESRPAGPRTCAPRLSNSPKRRCRLS